MNQEPLSLEGIPSGFRIPSIRGALPASRRCYSWDRLPLKIGRTGKESFTCSSAYLAKKLPRTISKLERGKRCLSLWSCSANLRRRIATMPKPAKRIGRGNGGQSLNDRVLQCLARSGADASQDSLQFGKRSLNRGEIGRVRRQKQELAGSSFDGLFDPRPQMDREIVQDHNLPFAQAGSQDMLN